MTREEVWMMEMTSCCRLQLANLKTNITAEGLKALPVGESLSYDCAAPQDETLFDTLVLFVERYEDTMWGIIGSVGYWSPMRGYSSKNVHIRRFDSEDDCIGWLKGNGADKECAEALYTECWPD